MNHRTKYALSELLKGCSVGVSLVLMLSIHYFGSYKDFWTSFFAGFIGFGTGCILNVIISNKLPIEFAKKDTLNFFLGFFFYVAGMMLFVIPLRLLLELHDLNTREVSPIGLLFGVSIFLGLAWLSKKMGFFKKNPALSNKRQI